jgi:CDP-6-deoxy-D-xylo-4-hexulose-3-dehydrase
MENNILKSDLEKVITFLKKKNLILTQSKNVELFEKKWSNWLGTKYSVFVNSGSSANLISIATLKEKYGSNWEIIVPSFTWVSDISSVIQNGFKPVFVDINPQNLSLDIDQVIKKITKKTLAVFITYAQGFNGLDKRLLNYLNEKKIHLIEDVCESHGAKYKNKKLGTFGLMSNFSFYYAHHMTTIEGGMVSTDNEEIYQMLRMIRSHGMVRESNNEKFKNKYYKKYKFLNKKFIFAYPSYNVRNNEIGAIIGINQLKKLDTNIKKRNINNEIFLSNIDSRKFRTDFDLKGASNYAFNLILKKPDKKLLKKLINNLEEHDIEFRLGSAGGGNQLRQPYLKKYIHKNEYLNHKETEHIHFYGMYIGNYPSLSKSKILKLCKIINST